MILSLKSAFRGLQINQSLNFLEGNGEDLLEFLRLQTLGGVVSILCNTAAEIDTVAEILGRCSEYKNFILYNRQAPHFSKQEVLWNLVDDLRKCKEKIERKGTINLHF